MIPDNNGDKTQDSECSNSVFGNAETYLVKDVPAYMQTEFNAAVGKHSLAVAGLSAGGTCATMLALRNPQTFSTFASYSGYASPTYQNDDEQQTIAQLYGGSKANYEAHNPVNLLTDGRFAGLGRLLHRRPTGPPTTGQRQAAGRSGQEDRDAGLSLHTRWRPLVPVLGGRVQDLTPLAVLATGPHPPPKDLPATCTPPIP